MREGKNKLVVAAAGSGKTTFLVQEALKYPEDRILITTYTQANEAEIRRKFVGTWRYVPAHIKIQTWFSFLLQHGVKPFQGCVLNSDIKGLLLVNQRSAPYVGEATPEKYYLNPGSKIYSDKLSKCAIRCNEKSGGKVIDRISRIFSRIFVDEVQDLAGYDLDMIKALFASRAAVVLVGDPRQVVYLTHHEQKHKKYSNGKIRDFVSEECRCLSVDIDDNTLSFSYRSHRLICELSDGLYPAMKMIGSKQEVVTSHDGVFLVAKKDVESYLAQFQPTQLRLDRRVKVNDNHPVYTFGESKGMSFDRVLIYPTKDMVDWIADRATKLAETTRARFYVALTRARYSVAVVCDKINAAGVSRWP